jgi:hypothetical protein
MRKPSCGRGRALRHAEASLAEKAFTHSHQHIVYPGRTNGSLHTLSLPMASTSPTAPELAVEPVHDVELNSFGSESTCDSAGPPPIHAVQSNDVASVWMLPDASAEEGALAAGESITINVMITVQSEPACIVQVTPC